MEQRDRYRQRLEPVQGRRGGCGVVQDWGIVEAGEVVAKVGGRRQKLKPKRRQQQQKKKQPTTRTRRR